MRLSFQGERVLAVVAHPDDVELLCAGTLARARHDGALVGICVLCLGDKGQPDPPLENLADVRSGELTAAAQLLGAAVYPGWVHDSTLFDIEVHRRELVERVRQFRPTLLLGHSPEDYHSDHRAASQLTDVASWLATSRGFPTESAALETTPAIWWMDTIGMHRFHPGFYVDVADHIPLKQQMLLCHASQLKRSGDRTFAPLMEIMHTQAAARGMQSSSQYAEAFQVHDVFKRAKAW